MSEFTPLECYRAEHDEAILMKSLGCEVTTYGANPPAFAAGRKDIPIDDYIKHWADGITAMEAGADQDLYAY